MAQTENTVQVAVCGAGSCEPTIEQIAYQVGRLLADAGAVVLTGGRGGVMAASCSGARDAGGTTVGILPGAPGDSASDDERNPHLDIEIQTGMGQARNQILVLSARAVIAVGGGWGTLSEIALATKQGVPVVLLGSWPELMTSATMTSERTKTDSRPSTLCTASTPAEAVALALENATKRQR